MRTAARALVTAALLLVAFGAAEDATPAEAKSQNAVLSGGDLHHPIEIPSEDGFVLWFPPGVPANVATFKGWPSRLDTPPETPGMGYQLSSGLEAGLLSPHDDPYALWSGIEGGEGRQPRATYYPAVAALEIRVGDDAPRWARLDDDRARLLNRYMRLGRAGALPEQPSILDVFAAEARAGRPIPATVDGRPLAPEDLDEFWRTADFTSWPEVPVYASRLGAKAHTGAPSDYDEAVDAMVFGYAEPVWLSFDIDGREGKLAYYPATGVIGGLPLPSSSAWVGRGFVIPPELREAFHASLGLPPLPPPSASADGAAPEVRDESPPDSTTGGHIDGQALFVALGFVGLLAIASALLVRRARRRTA